ncbi:30S ribosomal protein S13 [Candidatus Pacearchaeota archaeon]|nr:30S ribosomal protein S13 [Candidatus Pacearchaeota archaeon]
MAGREKQSPKEDQKQQKQKEESAEKKKQSMRHEEESEEMLIRISGYDIPGSKKLLAGLTRIKGVGWAISNAACLKLGFSRDKKIAELSKDEIKKIEEFLKNPSVHDYMKNRQKDEETGETHHFVGTDLEMRKDFDIRKMKKIRSYKGIRHTSGQPVRGQRTRSHFRKKGQLVAVRKKTEAAPAAKPKPAGGKK